MSFIECECWKLVRFMVRLTVRKNEKIYKAEGTTILLKQSNDKNQMPVT
jgi:hypothetical protein